MKVNQLNSYQNFEQAISSSYSCWYSSINYNGWFFYKWLEPWQISRTLNDSQFSLVILFPWLSRILKVHCSSFRKLYLNNNSELMSSILFWCAAVSKETEFEVWGFVLVMLAAVMSGFRWCMTQILLQVLLQQEYMPFHFLILLLGAYLVRNENSYLCS